MRNSRVFKLLASRIPHRIEFKITVTISLLFVLVAFAESCLHFYGADTGELPSPAHAWAWNMNLMQINSMRVYLFFFMPVLAALVFAGNARDDIRSGMAECIASRSSLTSYRFRENHATSGDRRTDRNRRRNHRRAWRAHHGTRYVSREHGVPHRTDETLV